MVDNFKISANNEAMQRVLDYINKNVEALPVHNHMETFPGSGYEDYVLHTVSEKDFALYLDLAYGDLLEEASVEGTDSGKIAPIRSSQYVQEALGNSDLRAGIELVVAPNGEDNHLLDCNFYGDTISEIGKKLSVEEMSGIIPVQYAEALAGVKEGDQIYVPLETIFKFLNNEVYKDA